MRTSPTFPPSLNMNESWDGEPLGLEELPLQVLEELPLQNLEQVQGLEQMAPQESVEMLEGLEVQEQEFTLEQQEESSPE